MRYLKFVNSATNVVPDLDSDGNATLAVGTYYAELGQTYQEWCGLSSLHWVWSLALAATITIDTTNFYNASLTASTGVAGRWVDVAAIADVVPSGAAIGQDISSWADTGYGRMRAKIVVTVQGTLAGCFHSKKNG